MMLQHVFKQLKKVRSDKTFSTKFAYEPVKSFRKVFGAKSKKTPIVISHGFFGSNEEFHDVAENVSKMTSRQVFCVDLRNHGNSSYSSKWTHGHMASDLKLLLEEEEIPKAIFLGHSLGGYVCMMTSIMFPYLVEALICVDAAPVKRLNPRLLEVAKLGGLAVKVEIKEGLTMEESKAAADAQMANIYHDVNTRRYILKNLTMSPDGSIKWKLNLDAFNSKGVEELGRICNLPENSTFLNPTLFIGGLSSGFIQKSDESEIKKHFPAAQFKYFEKVGHFPHLEQPDMFVDVISNYIENNYKLTL